MQAVFLMCTKNFSERQIGILFLAFGLSQFVFMIPAGYLLDYSNHKIDWVNFSGIVMSILTVITAITALDDGENMGLMIVLKIIQGGFSAILPPGFNSITLGIVGSSGFTVQVAKNRTMNHIGTALIVAFGSLIAYLLYPNIGVLFIVSPLTMIGVYYNMVRIKPNHVDRDAARALIVESPTMMTYEHLETEETIRSDIRCEGGDYIKAGTSSSSDSTGEGHTYRPPSALVDTDVSNSIKYHENVESNNTHPIPCIARSHESNESSIPSFRLGWNESQDKTEWQQPMTPLAVLRDPTLLIFSLVVFCFHLANSSVLPLVMQSLAVEDEKSGILLSGMCIFLGQAFMSWFAKLCGEYSPKWGRKGLILFALSSLTMRCFSLTILMAANGDVSTQMESIIVKSLIVLTQLLDSIGAGIFGTMHLVDFP